MRQFPELKPRQERALIALLEASSAEAAAKRAGISHATLHRWLKDPVFQQAYRQARRELVDTAILELQRASVEASWCLRDILTAPNASANARVQAAKTILELVREATLAEISERLDALEQAKNSPQQAAQRTAEERAAVLAWLEQQNVTEMSDKELNFILEHGQKEKQLRRSKIDNQTGNSRTRSTLGQEV